MMNRLGALGDLPLGRRAPAARGQPGNSRFFDDLLDRIPELAKALMLVNVDRLLDSP